MVSGSLKLTFLTCYQFNWLGTVHKRRPQSVRVCPMWTFCRQGGFFRCGRSHFLAQNVGFFEIYRLSAWTRGEDGWASADILRTRGEGVNFSRFCADVFYGRPL